LSFELKILGANSATPAYGRHHTAQVLGTQKHQFLIDCGEGTQERLKLFGISPVKIHHIFISHLHGDHYLGLMGIIYTMHLMGRTQDLHIYGQRGLEEIILVQLRYSNSVLNYDIKFQELDPEGINLIFEDKYIEVHSFPLYHRIPCCGFLFREKLKPIRLNKEKLPKDISLTAIGQLKRGEDVIDEEGNLLFKNKDLTLPPRKSCSYAFCSDTRYNENIVPIVKEVDLLYHETTFLKEMKQWAEKTNHSTTIEAAEIATKAKVKQLVIGHYSARYKEVDIFLDETRDAFPNTVLAVEGESIKVEDE
ncbi:MAG: ribonuclease Z, partial [Bacteroidota bacterium]